MKCSKKLNDRSSQAMSLMDPDRPPKTHVYLCRNRADTAIVSGERVRQNQLNGLVIESPDT